MLDFKRKLPIPMDVKAEYPVDAAALAVKAEADRELTAILSGESEKKLLVIGPCSADREDAVLEYASRLRRVSDEVKDKLHVIVRCYTNKPRTTGEGYVGMMNQPDPGKKPDPFSGVLAIRHLHTSVLTQTGLTTADELLYPADYRYLSDILSYVSVGARSTENQEHRFVASGLDIPVGMKNPTGGNLNVLLNSITAAQNPHEFIYRGWHVQSSGNPFAHAVLRGAQDNDGQFIPNYTYDSLSRFAEAYLASGLVDPAVIVDTNHANSGKNYALQPDITRDVLASCKKNAEIDRVFKGFMIESYLLDGRQDIGGSECPGCSITDPCLGWEKTEKLIYELADGI